ncbi:hypothetical protein TNCV_2270941 [Trichonephila clavipes]|nr:hypothetical protein TNCV_2270941 [Trichonephila clavipes]
MPLKIEQIRLIELIDSLELIVSCITWQTSQSSIITLLSTSTTFPKRRSAVVLNPLGAGKPTLSPFDLSTKECHKPYPAHQTTVSGICHSSPEDERKKQRESRYRIAQEIGTGVTEITTPTIQLISGLVPRHTHM